ncbi:MAG: hypothetical protein H0T62_01040 [Parachlamydiaceae bacterium]|nr:hypothetical protein [Parachlamydiaceae bacterium]
MNNDPIYFDTFYKRYMGDLSHWLPEGVIEVDLALLHRLGLLKYHPEDKMHFSLTRYFNVMESPEKITLLNDQFVIWISPEKIENVPITYTLIALNLPEGPRLEMAFATWGIYNSSRLVLRILEKFLYEIQETEDLLSTLEK